MEKVKVCGTSELEIPQDVWDKLVADYGEKPWPQYNDVYYYLDSTGKVEKTEFNSMVMHSQRLSYGNVFGTFTEARKVANKRQAEARIHQFIVDNKILLTHADVVHYGIYWDRRHERFDDVLSTRLVNGAVFRFFTSADTRKVINNCGQALKTLYEVN